MADIDLPVFSIPPNWSEGVTERLSWLTDVLTSRGGAEQRRASRLSPRREFEYKVNPTRNVRSFLDQWLHRISDERCLLPLWHDQNSLTVEATIGQTRLDFDARFTEFRVGDVAVIWTDPFTYEKVIVDAIDDDGIDLTAALVGNWNRGSHVYPARRVWMDPEVSSSAITSRVGDATLGFTVDGPNDYDTDAEVLGTFGAYPLVLVEPNRRDDLETQFSRVLEEMDGQFGLIRRFDEIGRSFQTQFYNWTAIGRQQHHELRQALYRLEGRQKAFWMPSFNEDVTLARPLVAGQNRLSIEKIGYTLLGGAIEGRNALLIYDEDGVARAFSITGTDAPLGAGEERLNLSGASAYNVPAGSTGSFMSTMRLENDVVEIMHHTDKDGVCEVGVACKSFADTREVVGPFIQERPEAVMSSTPCGDAPDILTTWYFKAVMNSTEDGQMGKPYLGNWIAPAAGGPVIDGGFVCNDPLDGSRYTWTIFEDSEDFVEQDVSCRYQGQGDESCPRVGEGISVIKLYIRGPGWPGFRQAPPVGGAAGVSGDGVLVDLFGLFPEDAIFHMYPNYSNPGWLA